MEGTPASETVVPPGLYEKTTSGIGADCPSVGVIRTDPLIPFDAAPPVANFCEERGGTEYRNRLLFRPSMVTFVNAPLSSRNSTVPIIGEFVGLTRRICV